eukprot:13787099-Alexandrium_andersonii.AAC.1
MSASLVGSEMCIRDRPNDPRVSMDAALRAGSLGLDVTAAGVAGRAAAGAGGSPPTGAASAAGRELAAGIQSAVDADAGRGTEAPLTPPMPARP